MTWKSKGDGTKSWNKDILLMRSKKGQYKDINTQAEGLRL